MDHTSSHITMNQHQILKHIRHHASTGVIAEELLPFFDQNGKWRGDSINWMIPVEDSVTRRIEKSVVPASRRSFKTRIGTVLKTSFYWQRDAAPTITYCAINGSLVVTGNAPIRAPSLRDIGGNLISPTAQIINLPCLTTVGGQVDLPTSFHLNAPRLRYVGRSMMIAGMQPPMLETVGGGLSAYWVFSFKASMLRHIGGCLVLPKAEKVQVPVLETVGGGILLTHLGQKFHAQKLQSVGGDFMAGSVIEIHTPRLRSVGGDLDTRCAKGFYHPRVQVGGEWTVFPGAIREWEIRGATLKAIRGDPTPFEI